MEVKSESELDEHWTQFADYYVDHFITQATGIYKSFLPFLKLAEASSVVEVGCGSGNGINLLLDLVPETCDIWCGDLNQDMLAHAQKSLPDRVSINQVNAESIPNEDSSADRFIANLIIQLTTFPEKVVAEAFRVLKPGGIAAFSVWGHRIPHNYFDILSDAARELGLPAGNERSLFHLNDPVKLTKMIKDAGFEKSLYFFYSAPMVPQTVDEAYIEMRENPLFAGFFNNFNIEQQQALKEKMLEGIVQRLEVEEQAFTVEALVIIAYK